MVKKYIVTLTAEERAELEKFTKTGRGAADRITRARILLKADSNQAGGGWLDEDIAAALDVSTTTVERTRHRFVELGLHASLKRRPGGGRKQRCLNGEPEAHLVALVCSEAPTGQARWSLRLLADEMVRLGYVESVSHETVRQTLKKTNFSHGSKTAG